MLVPLMVMSVGQQNDCCGAVLSSYINLLFSAAAFLLT